MWKGEILVGGLSIKFLRQKQSLRFGKSSGEVREGCAKGKIALSKL
jgi:hypothetical protein